MAVTQTESRTKTVAFFLPELCGGGAERMILNLIPEVRRLGYEPLLLLSKRDGALDGMVPPGTETVVLGASSVMRSFFPLVRFLRQRRPTLLVSSFGHPNIISLWARALAGVDVKVILMQHGILTNDIIDMPSLQYRALPFLYGAFGRMADAIIAVSSGTADDLARRSGLPRKDMTVIYNAAVTDRLYEQAEEAIEHPFFVEGGPPVFLGSGRLVLQKDFPTLLDAFALFRKKHDGRLAILGIGPLEESLKARCSELGLNDDVAFLGYRINPYPFMKRASAFVLSSRHEAFGIVLVEAMALGTPVVSTDCPSGPTEILKGGEYGALVPISDPPALARAMENVLKERVPAEMLKSRAAAFTVDAVARQYVDLFDRLCDTSGGTRALREEYLPTGNG
jgi:glycosyltransferase involved in cell wall biosynthesis